MINNSTNRTRDTMIKKVIKYFVSKGYIIFGDGTACHNWIDEPIIIPTMSMEILAFLLIPESI